MYSVAQLSDRADALRLRGTRCATGPDETISTSLVTGGGRITRLQSDDGVPAAFSPAWTEVDLSGYLIMPGLINAHDHLQYALHPRIGHPPYRNYIEWGEDIHATCSLPIAKYKSVPRDVRLWWGGIRNLLCGVTTVCHHDSLWTELYSPEFPVRVVTQYGWAHSLASGGDLNAAFAARPAESAFFIHACEGTDDVAKEEVFALERRGLLQKDTVLIHGLALRHEGVALLQKRKTSLIVCPSSNQFLFDALPNMELLNTIGNITLGSDSPLTGIGDLLDEVRFARNACHLAPDQLYRMVTESPAQVLRLKDGEGTIRVGGVADLIAVRDDGRNAADRLGTLSFRDVEFVMVRGEIRLASQAVLHLLPASITADLEPISIDGCVRWLRAPVTRLLLEAEAWLGRGEVRLGGRSLQSVDDPVGVTQMDDALAWV